MKLRKNPLVIGISFVCVLAVVTGAVFAWWASVYSRNQMLGVSAPTLEASLDGGTTWTIDLPNFFDNADIQAGVTETTPDIIFRNNSAIEPEEGKLNFLAENCLVTQGEGEGAVETENLANYLLVEIFDWDMALSQWFAIGDGYWPENSGNATHDLGDLCGVDLENPATTFSINFASNKNKIEITPSVEMLAIPEFANDLIDFDLRFTLK